MASEESAEGVDRTLDAQELRIRVGVHDDPTEPIREELGEDGRALRLDAETPAFLTVNDGLWAVAKDDGGEWREGPAERIHIMAGLARADSVDVLDVDDTPITGEVRF